MSLKYEIYFLLFFVLVFGKCYAKSDEKISVKTGENEFIGYEKVILDKSVNVFTGIPYAEPPLGHLRFKRPLPVQTKGVFEAKEWPKACPQNKDVQQSEDCLKLNIWSTDLTDSKPVMVWFHGGGFVDGFGHNGEVLAVTGDVVVVTINYRLGALGFLYAGRDDAPGNIAPGNMGIWDQVMALEWVNDYIQYFGGNSKQITVFGFSAGSRSISLHLLSPHSRQLFKNAIMMSGSSLSLLSRSDPPYVQRIYSKLAKSVGCSETPEFTDQVLECLRGIPYERLISAQHSSQVLESNFAFFPNILFGDQFIPEKPLEMLTEKDCKKKINLLIGTTEDEGSWILNRVDANSYPLNNPSIYLSKTEAITELESIFNGIQTDPRIDGQLVSKFYLQTIPENDSNLLLKTMSIALGDFFITCPALKFADILFNTDPKNNKVYGFYWNSKVGQVCGQWAGACHGSDVGPAFGYPFRKQKSSETERQISTKLMKTFAYFAKNNEPPAQEGIEWPHYYRIDGQTIAPFYEFSINPKNDTNFDVGLKHYVCHQLWNQFYH